jgi:hypothetical protein
VTGRKAANRMVVDAFTSPPMRAAAVTRHIVKLARSARRAGNRTMLRR